MPHVMESVREIMARSEASPATPQSVIVLPRGRHPGIQDDESSAPVGPVPPANPVSRNPKAKLKEGTTGGATAFAVQSLGTSFTAATFSLSGIVPPSSMGDVGPSQIMIVINGRIRTFNKSGTLDSAIDTTTDNFFTSVRNGFGTTDPRVTYDWLSQRWFVVMRNTATASNRILIAVSSGSTITSTSSFAFYYFQHDTVSPAGDTGLIADFPTLGIDVNSLYIGVNIFNSSLAYQGSTAFVVNKASLLTGTLTVSVFRGLTNMFSPVGVSNQDPAATQGYFIAVNTIGTSIKMRRVTYSGGVPSISGLVGVNLSSVSFTAPISTPAQGSTHPLDSIDFRLVNAAIVNGNLWTAHNVQVDATGTSNANGGRNAVRYYKINNLTTSPAVAQSGLMYDSAASNPLSYWIGSVATSGQGHTVMASSYAGNTAYAGVAITGRLSSDTVNAPPTNSQFTMPVSYSVGSGAYNLEPNPTAGFQRWGDYSNVVVDPTDNMTMWSFQEYTNAVNSWGVLVSKINAPLPATPSTASPASVQAGTTLSVTITGTSSGGSGFYDPGAGFANHLSASVSGAGVTVNSAAYSDSTHVTLNLTIASNAATGGRTITVTNPDGQSITSAAGFLTITGPAITISPSTLPTGVVAAAFSQTLTGSGGTAPYTFSITAGALPGGLTLTGSTGVISGTPTTSGTATFTIQARDSLNNTGSTQYTASISSMVTNNVSLQLPGTAWNGTAPPNFVGQFTLNTILTNNGPALTAPLYFKVTNLAKQASPQNPLLPDKLLTADNGAGAAGDIQTVNLSGLANSTLGTGQSVAVPFNVGIGERQTFSVSVDLYTVKAGSAATALDSGFFKRAIVNPTPENTVLLGQFTFKGSEVITPPGSGIDFNTPDPLSNMGLITGPGAQSRPVVAVDPAVPGHIVIASNDYVSRTVRISTTQDGGLTWHAATVSRALGNQTFFAAQNPSLAFDSSGRLSVVYTLSNLGDPSNAVVLSESADGITFNPPTAISYHPASDQVIDNRPVIAIRAGAGRYVAWESFTNASLRYSISLARSEESGPFAPAVTLVSGGLVGSPALALSNNTVYVGWDDWGFNSSPPYNTGGRLMFTSAKTGPKLKFDQPQEIARTQIGFAQKIPAMPDQGAGPGLSLAVDPKKENNGVYAVFTDKGNGLDIRLAHSGNGGDSWQLTTVNDDKGQADQFDPAIAVASDGTVKVSFYDTRLSSTLETAQVFLAMSTGDSFSNQRVTTISSNDSKSNPQRETTANLSDRTAIALTDGNVLVAWTDTRSGSEDIFASVVFDPDGASGSGTGDVSFPAGAYAGVPSLTGIAEFGFDAKYKKGVSAPTGDTELSFGAGKSKFRFKSTAYDSFSVAGSTLQLIGSGKINGAGDYVFLLIAVDGTQTGSSDKFQIQIADKNTGLIVFDNGIGGAGPQAVGDGEIRVRNK